MPTGPQLNCSDLQQMIKIVVGEIARARGNKSELEALEALLKSLNAQAKSQGCS